MHWLCFLVLLVLSLLSSSSFRSSPTYGNLRYLVLCLRAQCAAQSCKPFLCVAFCKFYGYELTFPWTMRHGFCIPTSESLSLSRSDDFFPTRAPWCLRVRPWGAVKHAMPHAHGPSALLYCIPKPPAPLSPSPQLCLQSSGSLALLMFFFSKLLALTFHMILESVCQ